MEAPQIRSLVDQFVADLQVVIRQEALEAVRGALGEAEAPAGRGPGRPRKATTRGPGRPRKASRRGPGRPRKATSRKGGRRTPEEVEALGALVLDHVRANPGQRLEEIGESMGLATKELKQPIAHLLEAKALRTTGKARGTKCFAGGGKRKAGKGKTAKRKVGKKKTAKKATKKKAAKRTTGKKKGRRVVAYGPEM